MQNSIFWKLSPIVIACTLCFSSCEKEALKSEEVAPVYADSKVLLNILQDPELFQQLKEVLPIIEVNDVTQDGASARNASFITPLINSDGFLLFSEYQISLFTIDELNEGDFWRENPDGTISVHINSDDALAFYSGEEGAFEGEQAKLNMNYTGIYTEVTIEFPFGTITFRYIDTSSDPQNAYVFSGTGDVISDDGTEAKLRSKFVRTPSGQRNGFIKLQ